MHFCIFSITFPPHFTQPKSSISKSKTTATRYQRHVINFPLFPQHLPHVAAGQLLALMHMHLLSQCSPPFFLSPSPPIPLAVTRVSMASNASFLAIARQRQRWSAAASGNSKQPSWLPFYPLPVYMCACISSRHTPLHVCVSMYV